MFVLSRYIASKLHWICYGCGLFTAIRYATLCRNVAKRRHLNDITHIVVIVCNPFTIAFARVFQDAVYLLCSFYQILSGYSQHERYTNRIQQWIHCISSLSNGTISYFRLLYWCFTYFIQYAFNVQLFQSLNGDKCGKLWYPNSWICWNILLVCFEVDLFANW